MTTTAKRKVKGNGKRETTTQKKRRLERARQKYADKMANENEDAKNARLENRRKYVQNQSSDIRLKRLKRVNENMAQLRKRETPEHHAKRLEQIRASVSRLRNQETPQQQANRLEHVRQSMSMLRNQETPEQRASRLEQDRESHRLHRASQNAEFDTFENAINILCNKICNICKKRCYPYQIARCTPSNTAAEYLPSELSDKSMLEVCYTCKAHITSSKRYYPAKAFWNNLDPGVIPNEIIVLSQAEIRLLARIIPFVKVIKFCGRFGQYGFKGQSVLFAQDLFEVTEAIPNILPRSASNCGMVVITEHLENINVTREYTASKERLSNALTWLIANNPLYGDVTVDMDVQINNQELIRVQEERHFEQPRECEVNARSDYLTINDTSRILRSSWHQGDASIFSPEHAGKQCCAMVLANIVRAHILAPQIWSNNILNMNMIEGDGIYETVLNLASFQQITIPNDGYLKVNNFNIIRNDFIIYNESFAIDYEQDPSFYGNLNDRFNDIENGIYPLSKALMELFEAHKAGILITDNKCFGVLNYDNKFYFTDSHACGERGASAKKFGRACVIECSTFDEFYRVCKRATGSKNTQFTLDYIVVRRLNNIVEAQLRDEEIQPQQPIQQADTIPTMECDNNVQIIPIQTSLMIPVDTRQPEVEEEVEISNRLIEIHRKTTDNIVNIRHELKHEEMAWYHLFPYGKNGLNEDRPVKITPLQYFNSRLLGEDTRFQSKEYLFYSLSMKEYFNSKSMISVCAKKIEGQEGMVDDVHLILRNIRGSSSFWRTVLSELIAQIRCLGAPTYFVTFSCNDLNWIDVRRQLLYADGRGDVDPNSLTINEVQVLIEKYPIVLSRHFMVRVNALEKFIKNNDQVFGGKLIDFWWRVEFQLRGSPHVHMLVWIENHPSFDTHEGIERLNQVVTCKMPDQNDELYELVKKCQIHRHTHTCKKNDPTAICRFKFPRQECSETKIVSHSSEEFIRSGGRICILKRRKEDRWVNNYNPILLKLWQANIDIQPCGSNEAIAYYVAKYISKTEPSELDFDIANAIRQIRREETNISMRLFKICMKILNERQVSACEAAFRLCHLNLHKSTRKCIFLNTRLPHQRYRVVRFENDGSASGYCETIFTRYMKRPLSHPNYNFDNMCLLEFAMLFEPHYAKRQDQNEDPIDHDAYEDDCESSNKYLKLTDNSKMIIRTRPAVVRTPFFNATIDRDNYYYSLLVSYLPFRNEADLLEQYESPAEAFKAREEDLKKSNKDMEVYRARDKQLENAFIQIHAFQILNEPEVELPEAEEVEMPEQLMNNEEFECAVSYMNNGQRELFKRVTKSIDDQLKGSAYRERLFITGGAGTGKTYTFNLLKNQVSRCFAKNASKVCALTGVAARLVGGSTIHSLFKLPVQKDGKIVNLPLLTGNYLQVMRQQWKDTEYLFIDEISMVPYEMLCMIDSRLKQLKNNEELFGGINVLLFGDLMQLPPVRGNQVFQQPAKMIPAIHLWRLFSLVELNQNMRQRGDTTFIDILNALRIGEMKAEHMQTLMEKVSKEATGVFSIDRALRIYPTNKQVNDHNNSVLQYYKDNNTEIFKIVAQDQLVDATRNMENTRLDKIIPSDINKTGGLPKELEIFVGAKVMLRSNINVEKGLVNGAIGVIKEIVWPLYRRGQLYNQDIPSVKVDFGFDRIDLIEPKAIQFPANYSYGTAERRMLPLILSWASTVHKMQGSTVEHAVIYLGSELFAEGQAYVALSRVKSLEGLRIEELECSKLTGKKPCNINALNEMERMRNHPPHQPRS